MGYTFNSIPDAVGEPGNSGVKPVYFVTMKGFCAFANTLRFWKCESLFNDSHFLSLIYYAKEINAVSRFSIGAIQLKNKACILFK